MKLTDEHRNFIRNHQADDVNKLLLAAAKYPDIDMPFVADQLMARRQIREKLPSWYACDELVFPSKVSAEQCSSEPTAVYKQQLVNETERLCDLTGGLGIDSFYFSRKVKSVLYIERFETYCEAARHNFDVLQATNITVLNGDATQMLGTLPEVDVFYIDPARRGEGDKRVYALQDCEPDLVSLAPVLLEKAPRIIAKLSPMADISHTLSLLPQTVRVHVLSVKNECKELLFELVRGACTTDPEILCVNLLAEATQAFAFRLSEEREAAVQLAGDGIGSYLYEPNASLLKAGAFRSVAVRFDLQKLHTSSHLYTSRTLCESFPGRRFRVDEVIPFAGKAVKTLSRAIPRANITVRNFPLTVDELRKRTRITDGGDIYLFATTDAKGNKILIRCSRI